MDLKLLRVMKLTAILMLSACLQLSAKGLGQDVNLSLKNVSLEKVFTELHKQTGYAFFYDLKQIKNEKKVSVNVKNSSIETVLEICLKDRALTYTIVGQTVVIKPAPKPAEPKEEEEIENLPPPIDVKGRVVNEKGEPVIATVTVKGTKKATSTNENGEFVLTGVEDDATLVITGVGIETFEVRVNGRADVATVTGRIKITEQEEVIINAGYYKTTKRNATGNISRVDAATIEKQPVSNPIAALQGRVPGLEIVQNTGVPGGNFTVRLRGQNSISNGNDPLYIINGVPYTSTPMSFSETSGEVFLQDAIGVFGGVSPLNYIDINTIESIEVLKDADATAIYGSRGANGVILITTKKGEIGKTKLDLTFYTGTAEVSRKMDLLNSQQYLQMRREALTNDGLISFLNDPSFDPYWPDLKLWDTTRYTDWQKKLIGGTARTTDGQLSISGGNSNTQFRVGGSYHKETTVFPGDNADQRGAAYVNLNNSSPNKKLQTSLSVNYSVLNSRLLAKDLTGIALRLEPVAPSLYDADGNLNWENNTWANPLAYLIKNYEAKTNNLIGNAVISYAILPSLEIKASLGYTNTNMNAITTTPNRFYGPISGPSIPHRSYFANSIFQNWIIEPQVHWKKQVGPGHLDLLVGSSFLEQTRQGSALEGTGFSSEALMKNIGAAAERTAGTNYYSQYRYNAIFGRVNYNLREKYIINITGRRDGSSRFGPGKQFANFGAIGAAWVFSKEDFVNKALPFLSFGKLTASYGSSGNDQLGDYAFLDAYTSYTPYMGNPTLAPVRLFNPDFAWEINKKLETGLEIGFIKDRILLGISYYRNRSSNQLVGYPLSPTSGFTSIQSNFPATVQNTGIELEVTTSNINNTNFSWTTSFNLTVPRNKLVAFPDLELSPGYANTLVVGEPLSIRKLYHYTGIDPQTGIYQFEDLNNDGVLNQIDKQIIKFVGQNFYGGLQNSFKFKNFQLDVLFQFVKQVGFSYLSIFGSPGGQSNQPVSVTDHWQKPGDLNKFQQFTFFGATTPYSNYLDSDVSNEDASFVRLKNLSLSYSLPSSSAKKLRIETARIFIQAQNMFTITKYKGLDPEVPGNSSLPPLRTITAGIHFIF